MAETSKYRTGIINSIVLHMGKSMYELDVLDIGSGDDPLTGGCDTFDLPEPYTKDCDPKKLTFKGDARFPSSVVKSKYDVVYSSHLLEDFARNETQPVLEEWLSLLHDNGLLVLLLPDQKRYVEHCKHRNEVPNIHHQINDFSMKYIMNIIYSIPKIVPVHVEELFSNGDYNFIVIVKKTA